MPFTTPHNPQEALDRLLRGNKRYAADQPIRPRQTLEHRQALLDGQEPVAVVLSCSDSRVPAELIFDQGFGDLFIVRTAGHVVSETVIASIEFAVHALRVPLVLVVGHSQCGAVSAAVKSAELPGFLPRLSESIRPAVEMAQALPGDLLENAVQANSRITADYLLVHSTIVKQAVQAGTTGVTPAYYDLATGLVKVLV